HAEMVHTGLK
nr:56 kda actin-sequestering protein, ASP-56=peptide T8 [swine, platelets, Peptide Partial, 10 aa] [Sus scrofa]